MVDSLQSALFDLLTLGHLAFLMIGVTLGLLVGVLPGLGGIAGMSMLLPFLFGLDQFSALAMLIGLVAVIPTSDTFASVLMGIPGSTASQATVLDGFPLAKKGEGARALAAAFSASLFGGLIGAAILTAFVLIARPLVLAFGTPELLALTVFGLSIVGVLSGRNFAKGIAAAALGLAVGSIGAAPATGEYRMDFGSLYLMDGVPLVIVALGLFAVPEIADLLRSKSRISETSVLGRGWLEGLRDTYHYKWLSARCAVLGAVIGAIPGLGGAVVDWMAYGHVVQTSKDKSRFGSGDIRGVIAPESANNAKEGGGLIPTLLFGIPGSGSMAVFLSGLVLLGVQPGPSMAGRDLDLTYTVIWSLALANVIGASMCILAAPGIARLTTIRYTLIAPFMIMVISFASFQATRSLYDLIALLGVGILGVMLRRFDWPRPAFLIGFVLASQAETYLYQAVQFSGWGFVQRPIVLIIIALTVISVWLGARSRMSTSPSGDSEPDVSGSTRRACMPQIVFAVLVLGGFIFALVESVRISTLGGVFLTSASVIGIIATAVALVPLMRGRTASSANFDLNIEPRTSDVPGGTWFMLSWLAGFVGLVALFGFFLGLVGFFLAFLKVVARTSWPRTLLLTASAGAVMLGFANAMSLVLPGGLLQAYFDMPWPLR